MLNQFSINAVSLLATRAAKAGLRLTPLETTPLSIAINACYNPSIDYVVDVPGKYPKPEVDGEWNAAKIGDGLIQGSMTKDLGGTCNHDVAMDSFAARAAKEINENNKLIRSVIVPMIERVVKGVQDESAEVNRGAMNPLMVVPDNLPPFWHGPALIDMIDKYSTATVEDTEIRLVNPGKTGQELLTMIQTGSRIFDGAIEAYLNTNDEARVMLRRVYQEMFARRGEGEGVDTPAYYVYLGQYLSYGGTDSRDRLLFAHLLARKLQADVPEGTGIGLGQYQLYMQTIITQTARMMNRIIEQRAADIKNRNLVLSFPSSTFRSLIGQENQIVVNGDLYNEWIAAGGEPEVLFGAYVTGKFDRTTRNYEELLEHRDELKAIWARQYDIRLAAQMSRIYDVTLSALNKIMGKEITELHNDNMIGVSRKPYFDLLEKHLIEVSRDQLDDLEGVVTRLICRVIFPHRDVEKIIVCINLIGKRNPGLTDGRQAALYGIIVFVADWVSKLYSVKSEAPGAL